MWRMNKVGKADFGLRVVLLLLLLAVIHQLSKNSGEMGGEWGRKSRENTRSLLLGPYL